MDIQKVGTDSAIITPIDNRIILSNADDFKKALVSVYDDGIYHVIIDFKNVTTIDSTGLGKILVFNKRIQEQNGSLTIRNVNSTYVRNLFTVLRLSEIIKVEDRLQNQ